MSAAAAALLLCERTRHCSQADARSPPCGLRKVHDCDQTPDSLRVELLKLKQNKI